MHVLCESVGLAPSTRQTSGEVPGTRLEATQKGYATEGPFNYLKIAASKEDEENSPATTSEEDLAFRMYQMQ